MGRRSHKQFASIAEVLRQVDALELRCARAPKLYSLSNETLTATLKALISLCNSLAVVFLQYDLLEEALGLLKRAGRADSELYRVGTLLDRLWQGRIVTYNNLAYLFQKVDNCSAALKFVYDAQTVLLTIQKAGAKIPSDIALATNFVTFFVLWRAKKYQETPTYIQLCIRLINQLLRDQGKCRLTHSSQLNLLGLVAMGLAAVQFLANSDLQGALQTLQQCLRQIEKLEVASKPLVEDLCVRMQQHTIARGNDEKAPNGDFAPSGSMHSPKATIPDLPPLHSSQSNSDWLISADYDLLFFITTLLPFISPNMPLIRRAELEQAQKRRGRQWKTGEREETNMMKSAHRETRRFPTSLSPAYFQFEGKSHTPSPQFRSTSRNRTYDTDFLSQTAPLTKQQNLRIKHGSVPPLTTKAVILSPDFSTQRRRHKRTLSRPVEHSRVPTHLPQSPAHRSKTYQGKVDLTR